MLGWDDFVISYKESDPKAFEEETPQAVANTGTPHNDNGVGDSALRKAMGL